MNVILLEHMDDLGTVGQTVKVKNGYARHQRRLAKAIKMARTMALLPYNP